MTTKYLDSKRISGTTADRNGVSAVAGGWKELGRTTLESTGDTIDVSSLADKRYYMVLGNAINTGGVIDINQRFGSTTIDTGNNYARRQSINGGSDGASAPRSNIDSSIDGAVNHFMVSYIANKSDKEKLVQSSYTEGNATGAGSAPERSETVGKWTNTSNPIDIMRLYNTQAGDYTTGSECVVLGWDPSDTHTTNFWEELVDTSWSSGSSVETSAFATKKYLWYQGWFKTGGSMSGSYSALQVGSGGTISTSGYAERYSINGATDGTDTNSANMYGLVGQGNDGSGNELTFINGFIINNSANEKLFITHSAGFNPTTGAGSAPNRTEGVGKWANTSSQINKIKILSAAGSGDWVGGQLKVWGSN